MGDDAKGDSRMNASRFWRKAATRKFARFDFEDLDPTFIE